MMSEDVMHAQREHDERSEHDIRTVVTNLEDLHTRIYRMLACNHIQTEALARLYARAYLHFENASPLSLSQSTSSAESAVDPVGTIFPDPQQLAAVHDRYAAAAMPSPGLSLPHQKPLLDEIYRQLSASEQLCFYRTLAADAALDTSALAARLLGRPEPLKAEAKGRIVYQHSIYTDEAFLHFSRVLPTALACYSDSFTGVCEQVFDGQCEYCILPLENTQDGKLVRFYGLIEKYELKIALTCTVTTSDNRHSTVFGLCRRGITWPQRMVRDRSVCFELIFWQEPEHLPLSRLLSVAECASLSLLRADCLPRSDDEILMGAGYPFDLCFELTPRETSSDALAERDFLGFLMFLSVHSPTHLPLGIYQKL